MIELINKQRRRHLQMDRWRDVAERALAALGTSDAGVTIAFVSDRSIQELNRRFREKNRPTDVLSFPSEQAPFEINQGRNLGDIVISVERAAAQAAEHGMEFEDEISQLILHGLIHLHGYDHETDGGEMNSLELELREKLAL
jgi:probable rRNA maturation factor